MYGDPKRILPLLLHGVLEDWKTGDALIGLTIMPIAALIKSWAPLGGFGDVR